VNEVQWIGRRLDVIDALEALATLPTADPAPRPDLHDAVHWLVDDTWWDQHPPAEEIGFILRDQREAIAIEEAIMPLLAVLDELKPGASDNEISDAACFDHRDCPKVRSAAGRAYRLLSDQA
jgi:hypothetical protein